MTRLLIFVGMTIGSWVGWAIGEKIEGLMTALILSGVLGGVGAYGGWKATREWMD